MDIILIVLSALAAVGATVTAIICLTSLSAVRKEVEEAKNLNEEQTPAPEAEQEPLEGEVISEKENE